MRRNSEHVFEPIAGRADVPWPPGWTLEGVIETLEPMVGEARRTRILEVARSRVDGLTLLMDAPHDPHNGAAVIRSCEAFGIQELHVVPRDESFQLTRSVTKGAERWVDVVQHASPQKAAAELQRQGYELISTHPKGSLVPSDLAGIPKLAIVLGNERAGIGEELQRACARSVRVPMVGFVESLNLSVSAAILLYAASLGRRGPLPSSAQRRLYGRALYLSVQRADRVLAALRPR